MRTEILKMELIKMLIETESQQLLQKVKSVFENEKKDFWNELSDEQKQEIHEGIKELDQGERYSYEDIMRPYRK